MPVAARAAAAPSAWRAAALFAFWPLLTRPLAGPSAWENGQWNVDVGLHLYTEPLSTALVAVALALLLAPRLDELRLALAGALLGYATVVRVSNGFFAAAAVLLVAFRLGPRRALPLAAAGAAFAPLVAVYWPKGYPEIPNVPGFSLDQAGRSWADSLIFDPRMLLVLLPLAVLGLFALRPWASALLGASIATNAIFYTFYEHTHLHPRFLYASLPALFVLESAGAHRVWRSVRGVRIGSATALLGLLLLCAGGGSAGGAVAAAVEPSVASWEARSAPFRLLFRDEGRRPTAVQVRERGRGPGSSLGYDLEDGSSHRLTDLIRSSPVRRGRKYIVGTDEPTRKATVIVQRTGRGLRVAWTFEPAAGVARVYESFAARDGEHFLGGGQQGASVDLRGRALELKVSYGCGRTIVAPFYLSSTGYGVLFRTSAIGHLQFAGTHDGSECSEGIRGKTPACPVAAKADRVQACFKTRALTYEVYAGSPTEVVSAYTAAVGRPRLPPPSQFALIKWRDEVAGGAELLDDAARLRRAGIALGWVIVDNPWEENRCLGTLAFDPVRFPEPGVTFAALRQRGVKVMLWVSPYLSRREDCPAPGFPDGTLRQGDELEWSIDLTDGRAAAIWRSRLRASLALGVDGIKGDRGDELDHEPDTFAAGPGTLVHNLFPAAFARESFAELRRRGRDVATIYRAATPESIRELNGVWAGDQPGTFVGLRMAVRMAQTAGVSGFPIWGSDIGGYHSAGLTRDVFVRWAQFAAATPIFEVGGIGPNARFWTFGPETVELFRRAAVLHYELFPYLYELARRAARTGLPIVRPLGLAYPADDRSWSADLEFVVGDDLLVAPVTSRRGNAHRVYLPPGDWIDVARGSRHAGGHTIRRPTPLDELPLYLRAGKPAVPFNARTPAIWADPWRINDLRRPGRAGWLVAPGPGRASASSKDAGSIGASRKGAVLELSLRGAPRETQIVVLAGTRPKAVLIGGRRVAASRSAAALRRVRTGWMFTEGPRGGVVLKLTGAGAAARVRLVSNS